jgi:hypothetical protein
MRIGEIERVGEREIPMPNLTPQAPPEPMPHHMRRSASVSVSRMNLRGCLEGFEAAACATRVSHQGVHDSYDGLGWVATEQIRGGGTFAEGGGTVIPSLK